VSHVSKLGPLRSARHCKEVRFHCSVEFAGDRIV
jgi:hypothetical protein